MNSLKISRVIKNVAFFGLLLLLVPLILFSLVSGSEDHNNQLTGIIKNSPNAIPWVVLLGLLFLGKTKPKLSGILIILVGLIIVYFFNFSGPNFWWITFIVTALIPIFGLLYLMSWYIKKQ